METLRVVLLAIVQGLTEFLPISSDGHLLVAGALFEAVTGRELGGEQITLTIVLHAGTLLTVLVVFWKQILRLATVDRRVVPLLIVGTIPAGIIGILLKKFCHDLLNSELAAGLGLIATGLVLLWSRRVGESADDENRRPYQELTYGESLIIGTFQAVAILPGVSRSGCTIASGLKLCGLKRSDAANFSFLLSIPAIAGAVLLEVIDLWRKGSAGGFAIGDLVLGTVVSAVVGFAALKWLLSWLRHGKLHYFAWWCIPLGIVVTIWQLVKA